MSAVALVTARAARALDTDLAPLAAALTVAGVPVTIECWDDPDVDWGQVSLAVLRSTWDYHERLDEFSAWLDRVAAATTLANPPHMVRWSLDKRYLSQLAAAGVPVVPTVFLAAGEPVPPLGAAEIVVKPTVSAGSRDTGRFGADEPAGQELLARIWASGRTAMVQPYQQEVDTAGEHALVYLQGVCSHAFRKGPILRRDAGLVDALFAEEDIGPASATAAQRAVGDAAMALVATRFGVPPLYARVDLVPGDAGPVVLELELAEPSLYFDVAPGSAARFAAAIAALVRSVP